MINPTWSRFVISCNETTSSAPSASVPEASQVTATALGSPAAPGRCAGASLGV
jgi:hypothetical protein